MIWYLVLSGATSFHTGPECQKGNTASFPVILRLEKAQRGERLLLPPTCTGKAALHGTGV